MCTVFLYLPRSGGGTAWLGIQLPNMGITIEGRSGIGKCHASFNPTRARTHMRQSVSHKVPYPSITTIHYSTSVQAMVGAELDSQIHPHPHTYIPRSASRQEDEEVRERKKESRYVR
ncbi:hypothetical protein BKA80DRAFT_282712 [Phyllosticta citrichinensis]